MGLKVNEEKVYSKAEENVKLLIIGSGPAGLAAALYAARADLNPVVLTGMTMGGQASLTHLIENYPGFPEGLGGAELGELFKVQAERFGTKVVYDTAIDVDFSERPYRVETYNSIYFADTLIISTGANPRHLDIKGEEEFTGKGVSYCGTCDGFFFKDKEIVVVGGGDSALEESIFLSRFASKITIIHRRDELRAGKILVDRAIANEKINFIWDSILVEIKGEDQVTEVVIKNVKTGEFSDFSTEGVFIFIGHIPNSQLFESKLELDSAGYLIVNNLMETSELGVYAAGEIADSNFRQVITSAGMGAAAAIQVTRFLEAEE